MLRKVLMLLLMLLVLCVIGGVLPFLNTIAVLIPQLFPRVGVTIRGLNEMEHAGFTSAVIRGLKAGMKS